jgi:hypothetical protein
MHVGGAQWQDAQMDLLVPPGASYVFDLTNSHARRRRRALERHAQHVEDVLDALTRQNEIWRQAGGNRAPTNPGLAAAMDQVGAEGRDASAHTLPGIVYMFLQTRWNAASRADYERLAPYAVLYLQWETLFPEEWREANLYSPWKTKKQVLRGFAKAGAPQACQGQLIELLAAAIRREHRCEDGGYPALARRVDGPELRSMLADAAGSTDPLVRLRAEYVLWVAENPRAPVTVAGWRRWLADDDGSHGAGEGGAAPGGGGGDG